MKYRYGKFVPDLLDELDMDELMSKLSDLLLASGFNDPYFSGTDDERSMQALYDAILDALLSGGVLPDDRLQELLGQDGDETSKQRIEELIKQIMERMQESGFVTAAPDLQADQARRAQGQGEPGQPEQHARFEVTDKALDFLGFRALRDLLGSLGKSSFGRHDTRDLATGIEASGATKPYEFGDTLNLDASATLLNAIRRGLARAWRSVRGQARNAGPRARGPGHRAGRVPELMRHGDHARLQPQHDPLRRGSLHARQAGGHGAFAADPAAVSR